MFEFKSMFVFTTEKTTGFRNSLSHCKVSIRKGNTPYLIIVIFTCKNRLFTYSIIKFLWIAMSGYKSELCTGIRVCLLLPRIKK